MNDTTKVVSIGLIGMAVLFGGSMLVLGPAHPKNWDRMARVQAEQGEDYERLNWMTYVSRAGTLPCPAGSEDRCDPSQGFSFNCCGEGDAYEADEIEIDKYGNVWAILTCNDPKHCEETPGKIVRKPGEKFRIPPGRILMNKNPVNNTGHGVVWISPNGTDENGQPTVYCDSLGAGF